MEENLFYERHIDTGDTIQVFYIDKECLILSEYFKTTTGELYDENIIKEIAIDLNEKDINSIKGLLNE